MNTTYLYGMIDQLLNDNGELSAERIAEALSSDEYAGRPIPIRNVELVLFCRPKRFGKNIKTGRWGIRN